MKKNSTENHILFAAQLPPPLNGSANVSEYVLCLIKDSFYSCEFVNMRGQGKRLSYFFSRIFKSIKICKLLISNFPKRKSTIYYISVSDGWGMLFELLPWVLSAVLAKKRIMHHHSFKYCYKKNLLMHLMQKSRQKSIVNITLCNNHKQAFYSRYNKSVLINNVKVIENDFIVEKIKSLKRIINTEKVIIGHISNLSIAKGFDIIIKIFDFFRNDDTVIFEIAGPVLDKQVHKLLNKYVKAYPDNFYYRGPLYEQAKNDWYQLIDIFLFPTNYTPETYPLVILEAISNKIIPFTTPIGCLCEINNPLFISGYLDYYTNAINFIQKYKMDVEFKKSCVLGVGNLEIKLKNNAKKSKYLLLQQLSNLNV